MESINIGVIGLGNIAQSTNVPNLQALDGVDVIAAWSQPYDSLREACDLLAIPCVPFPCCVSSDSVGDCGTSGSCIWPIRRREHSLVSPYADANRLEVHDEETHPARSREHRKRPVHARNDSIGKTSLPMQDGSRTVRPMNAARLPSMRFD